MVASADRNRRSAITVYAPSPWPSSKAGATYVSVEASEIVADGGHDGDYWLPWRLQAAALLNVRIFILAYDRAQTWGPSNLRFAHMTLASHRIILGNALTLDIPSGHEVARGSHRERRDDRASTP